MVAFFVMDADNHRRLGTYATQPEVTGREPTTQPRLAHSDDRQTVAAPDSSQNALDHEFETY